MKLVTKIAIMQLLMLAMLAFSCTQAPKTEPTTATSAPGFKGDIKLDVRDSKPELGTLHPKKGTRGIS